MQEFMHWLMLFISKELSSCSMATEPGDTRPCCANICLDAVLLCCQASDQYLLEGLKRLCEAALAEVRPAAVEVLLS